MRKYSTEEEKNDFVTTNWKLILTDIIPQRCWYLVCFCKVVPHAVGLESSYGKSLAKILQISQIILNLSAFAHFARLACANDLLNMID